MYYEHDRRRYNILLLHVFDASYTSIQKQTDRDREKKRASVRLCGRYRYLHRIYARRTFVTHTPRSCVLHMYSHSHTAYNIIIHVRMRICP